MKYIYFCFLYVLTSVFMQLSAAQWYLVQVDDRQVIVKFNDSIKTRQQIDKGLAYGAHSAFCSRIGCGVCGELYRQAKFKVPPTIRIKNDIRR